MHLLDLVFNVKFAFNTKARRTHLELSRLRALYQIELDFRERVLQTSRPRSIIVGTEHLNIHTQGLLVPPLDDPQKSHNLSSHSIPELAELRAWQQTAYALACIDTALSFISNIDTTDVLTTQICETMHATILSFPGPQTPSTVTETFISLCKTLAAHPTTVQLCVWASLTSLAHAAAVDQSPVLRNKTCDVLPLALLSVPLVASLVAVWWARRRATHCVTDRGTQAPSTPSQYRPLSIPSPVYLASRAPYTIFHTANALTVNERPRSRWINPEIVLAGLSIILTVIGLVLTGLSLLYAQRAVPKA